MTNNHQFDSIPIIDLHDWRRNQHDRKKLAVEMCDICHNVGFMQIINHGIDPRFMRQLFQMVENLFALPIEQKLLIDKKRSRHFRGWENEGTEYTNNRPDIREQVDIWSETMARSREVEPHYLKLLGPNQWLPESILPEFKPLSLRWIDEAENLSTKLLSLLSTGLGLSENHINNLFGKECMSLTKLIRYPPTPKDAAGVNPHHDTGFLTVLAPGETPGLEVQNAIGQWIPVPHITDSLVINLGEMLQGMTNNYFVATPHRVITNALRYAVGYFHGPSLDTKLTPLPLASQFTEAVAASTYHAQAGFMATKTETESGTGDMESKSKPKVYGEQLWNYFVRSYPDIVLDHYPEIQ